MRDTDVAQLETAKLLSPHLSRPPTPTTMCRLCTACPHPSTAQTCRAVQTTVRRQASSRRATQPSPGAALPPHSWSAPPRSAPLVAYQKHVHALCTAGHTSSAYTKCGWATLLPVEGLCHSSTGHVAASNLFLERRVRAKSAYWLEDLGPCQESRWHMW